MAGAYFVEGSICPARGVPGGGLEKVPART